MKDLDVSPSDEPYLIRRRNFCLLLGLQISDVCEVALGLFWNVSAAILDTLSSNNESELIFSATASICKSQKIT